MQPYKPCAFRFSELCRFGKWQMKLYAIACLGEFPRTELLAAAKKVAAIELVKFEPNDFYLGFIGVHDGRNAAFIFVDFWGNENELFHRVFLSRGDKFLIFLPRRFGPVRLRVGSGAAIIGARSLDQTCVAERGGARFRRLFRRPHEFDL